MQFESLTSEDIAHLPAGALVEIVLAFRAVLYPGGESEQEWNADTLGELAALCARFGLNPSADGRESH